MSELPHGGSAEEAFAGVAEAFRENFAVGAEVGAAVCVYHRGKSVVDLWGGYADAARTDPWRPNTLAVLASPTKALVTGAALMLVDRGVLELDTPIAEYWPEFAAEGKSKINLRMVLAQRSGVVCLDHDPITYEYLVEHVPIANALAAAKPEWEPDTAHGYHATTFGHLVSELVLRTTGRTVGQFIAREIAEPLGLDCYIGLPDPESAHLATMLESKAEELMAGAEPGDELAMLVALGDPSSLTFRAALGSMALTGAADPKVENPSYDGLSSAQSLARFYAALIGEVDGFRMLTPETVDELRKPHSSGICKVTLLPRSWGLGFNLPNGPVFPPSVGLDSAFGLAGANGNFTFADPEHELGFAYVQNSGARGIGHIEDRARRLTEAVYSALR
ncbi:serine hydrolase domain-containing protein [Amycolatopsis palatopharyngis]|uniref:serine hydrolase domain-containing protein n=1 Tax=Amycolatopsis palatopharyngis TaxID=187982 RepID=UPI000E2209BD|nr:serine hydrolase domain-containing protein [Amycolatopsis palatopharyngis]